MAKGIIAAMGLLAMLFPAMAQGATPAAGHLRVAIDTESHEADFSRTAARQSYVILHDWEDAKRRAIKAANPKVRVLLYRNLGAMMTADRWGNTSTGVTTQEADRNPEWYLHNTGGRKFSFGSYGWLWAADIGHRGYQERWTRNVQSVLEADGWDGVFVDDTGPTLKYHYDPSRISKYPTDAAYAAATRSALAYLGPRIRATGKLVIPNITAWREYRPVAEDWLQFVDGAMDEMFTKWSNEPGEGYLTGAAWEDQMREITAAEDRGKAFLAVAHSSNTDVKAARYGWATVLLASRGRATFALHGDYTRENWFPEYDYDLGAPSGPATKSGGVWRRAFARGLVVVNPGTDSTRVELGGTYSGSGLRGATQATMGAHTGLILTRDGASAPRPAGPRPTPPASVPVKLSCLSYRTCTQTVVLQVRRNGEPVKLGSRKVKVSPRKRAKVSVRLTLSGRLLLSRRGSLAVRVARKSVKRSGRARITPKRVRLRAHSPR